LAAAEAPALLAERRDAGPRQAAGGSELQDSFEYGAEVASGCANCVSGIAVILTKQLLPDITREFLTRMIEGKEIKGMTIGVMDGDFICKFK
jgi:hypothetical protein